MRATGGAPLNSTRERIRKIQEEIANARKAGANQISIDISDDVAWKFQPKESSYVFRGRQIIKILERFFLLEEFDVSFSQYVDANPYTDSIYDEHKFIMIIKWRK